MNLFTHVLYMGGMQRKKEGRAAHNGLRLNITVSTGAEQHTFTQVARAFHACRAGAAALFTLAPSLSYHQTRGAEIE